LVVPPPPQVSGEVQVPHELTVREAPQLSVPVTEPQFLPSLEQKVVLLSGVQLDPQTPLSVHTTPQGHPLAPGAQLANPAQLAQLPLLHVQLWPFAETWVPCRYERQFDWA
jgi:hypothetical protein